jgi:hypothetical protein
MFATSDKVIDQVNIPGLATDDSFARIPDGSSNWQITTTPTIDAGNIETSSTTPTPIPTSSQASTSSSGSGTTGASGSTGTTQAPPFTNGTQPAWNNLSLPQATAAVTSTTSIADSPLTKTPTPSPTSSAPNLQHRILLTILLLLLAASLYWCWKLYSS